MPRPTFIAMRMQRDKVQQSDDRDRCDDGGKKDVAKRVVVLLKHGSSPVDPIEAGTNAYIFPAGAFSMDDAVPLPRTAAGMLRLGGDEINLTDWTKWKRECA
jgi:hypothetical protein